MPTLAKGASWDKGMASGNMASSPVDSAAGLVWGLVRGEKMVTPHLLAQGILTAALGNLDAVAPTWQVKMLSLREPHKTVALS